MQHWRPPQRVFLTVVIAGFSFQLFIPRCFAFTGRSCCYHRCFLRKKSRSPLQNKRSIDSYSYSSTTLLTMRRIAKGIGGGSKRKNNRQKQQHDQINIVGPDTIQLLQGQLLGKQVALVLCGESHEDAIDVTRAQGRFDPKEGWVEIPRGSLMGAKLDNIVYRITATTKKSIPLQKSKEWAKTHVVDEDVWGHLVLLWVEDTHQSRSSKGKAYVLQFADQDDLDNDDDDDSSDDDDDEEEWVSATPTADVISTKNVPPIIREWIQYEKDSRDSATTTTLKDRPCHAFEWGDLDPEAYELNTRRLTDEEISTKELDAIIHKRKTDRRQEDIWTWDDWFAQIRTTASSSADNDIAVQLVLEASIPPWELELHRPTADTDMDQLQLPPAADCIRCAPKDEEGALEDEHDPSADGVGSYIDFVYRRFMEEMVAEHNNEETTAIQSTWLHCVDTRDLGCQAACHSDSAQKKWKDLLLPDEIPTLLENNDKEFLPLIPDVSNKFIKFVPESRMNPERLELEHMQSNNLLKEDDDEEEEDDDEEEETDFTFPSFEGFFGQNTDFLYYSPHVHLLYAPFLAKCVRSLFAWETFFTNLFLGGTIPDALSILHLNGTKDHLYVRSPLLKIWNPDTSSYDFQHRDDGEHYITYPYFPYIFYLTAQGTSPPRTWSSQLFARLCTAEEHAKSAAGSKSCKDIAIAAREWTLKSIQQHAKDPKGSDDPHCGGEWFEAFLRAEHRDIYDDIDLSDPTVLLRKKYMKSESYGKKHNIGQIKIPPCQKGFQEIVEGLNNVEKASSSRGENSIVTPRVEVMAKILIDIWMSNLIDFSTVLKVAEIVSESKNDKVVVVCYMGAVHTRAASDFYTSRMGFKKKAFIGKVTWDETEPHTLKLPSNLWNIPLLFK